MIHPVELQDFLLNFFAAALVILAGACYALCYAGAKLTRRPVLMRWAYGAYAVLVLAVWALADTAHLDGYWRLLTALMLVGYFAAPRAIFRLCADTHTADDESLSPPPQETPP